MDDFTTVLNTIGTWTIGSFTALDLLAATTNAFNGAILISRRDQLHWRPTFLCWQSS